MALYAAYERAEERLDRRTALLAAILANSNRGPDTPPFEVADFMPGARAQEPTPTAEVLEAKLSMFYSAFGIKPEEVMPDGCSG